MKIAINGGHFIGLDCGAIGPTGLQEAVVTKKINLLVMRKKKSCYAVKRGKRGLHERLLWELLII